MKKIGLYIHIPFCCSKCPYCDFYSVKSTEEKMDGYTERLCSIIAEKSKGIPEKADSVYFGGGTPSVLGDYRLLKIMETVKACHNLSGDCEVTLEANPISGKALDYSLLKRKGFNRISLGVQTAVKKEAAILGRKHTNDDVTKAVAKIKSGGIDNISADIMLGIPYQNKESLKETINFASDLGVTHLSAYILKIEENTLFYRKKDTLPLPCDEEVAELYLYFCDEAEKRGFKQYEISNFAKDGFASRHNLKYWNCEEYVGYGPSAHSFYRGERFYYSRSFADFYSGKAVNDGAGGNAEEYILLRLRLNCGVSEEEYKEKYGKNLSQTFYKNAEKFIRLGYMEKNNDRFSLTGKGFLISNYIISELI